MLSPFTDHLEAETEGLTLRGILSRIGNNKYICSQFSELAKILFCMYSFTEFWGS